MNKHIVLAMVILHLFFNLKTKKTKKNLNMYHATSAVVQAQSHVEPHLHTQTYLRHASDFWLISQAFFLNSQRKLLQENHIFFFFLFFNLLDYIFWSQHY